MSKRILLHICCGVCVSPTVEKLRKDGFEVTGLFYNPNIHPEEEYLRRLAVAQQVAENLQFAMDAGPYDKENWHLVVKGMEQEKEGGRRCQLCYRMRLKETHRRTVSGKFDYFTTTLTISPHKDSKAIHRIGTSIGRGTFLDYDFKKEDGFKKAMQFAKAHALYRQHFCGCIFSNRHAK